MTVSYFAGAAASNKYELHSWRLQAATCVASTTPTDCLKGGAIVPHDHCRKGSSMYISFNRTEKKAFVPFVTAYNSKGFKNPQTI
jgi:hypothetical protein